MRRCLVRLGLSIGGLLQGITVVAQPFLPAGTQFQINTWTAGQQLTPWLAVDERARFVVAWRSEAPSAYPWPRLDVRAQLVGADGNAVGGERIVVDQAVEAAVATGIDGTFLVVWAGPSGVSGRRLAADGNLLGGALQVGASTAAGFDPAVASFLDGSFIVAWRASTSAGSDTSSASIQAQRLAVDGSRLGAQLQVNTYTTDNQTAPAVAALPDGRFLIVWESHGSAGTDSSFGSIQGRRYTAEAIPLGDDFQINTYTFDRQSAPAVAASANTQGFLVVWQSRDSAGPDVDDSIQAQRIAADGQPLGAEVQVNTYTFLPQTDPAVAATPDGSFVVVWTSEGSSSTDTSLWSIQGRRLDRDGTLLATDFQINDYTPDFQLSPHLAAGPGRFVVVWESYSSTGTDDYYRSIQARAFIGHGLFTDSFEAGSVVAWSGTIP